MPEKVTTKTKIFAGLRIWQEIYPHTMSSFLNPKSYLSILISFCFLFPFAASAGTISKPPNNLGLTAYWSFNEGTSTVATDFSGNGHQGALTNMDTTAAWVVGKRGKALSFDGTNDYVDLGTSSTIKPTANKSFSVSLWYKGAGTGAKYFIASPCCSALQSYWYVGEAEVSFFSSTQSTLGTNVPYTLPSNNEWHNIITTLDRSTSPDTATVYIDGVLYGSATETEGMDGGSAGGTGNTYIGRGNWLSPAAYRDGPIDDVRLYRRALTAAEAKQLYLLGK